MPPLLVSAPGQSSARRGTSATRSGEHPGVSAFVRGARSFAEIGVTDKFLHILLTRRIQYTPSFYLDGAYKNGKTITLLGLYTYNENTRRWP